MAGAGLPEEVLELVLAQLPLPEVLTNMSLVNHAWHAVISNPIFLRHRKLYWRYKLSSASGQEELEAGVAEVEEAVAAMVPPGPTTTSTRDAALQQALPWLLQEFSSPTLLAPLLRRRQVLLPHLHRHPRHPLAVAVLEGRFPHLAERDASPAALWCLIMVTASTVAEVASSLELALEAAGGEAGVAAVELVYRLATLLLALERRLGLPPRHHYLLQHALALHLAAWTHDPTDLFRPGTEASSIPLTAEQRTIVNMDLRRLLGTTDTVRIVAYAGTGKTTTLVELTKRNPGVNFLLVVFNKAVQLHSQGVFPANVTVRTANALSYKFIRETEEKERFVHWGLKYCDLIQHGLMPWRRGEGLVWVGSGFNIYHRAAIMMATLTNYYQSADLRVGLQHAPEEWVVKRKDEQVRLGIPPAARAGLVTDAAAIWRQIQEGRTSSAKYDQDSAMKKFQLARPCLADWFQYDVLLLDEAQDMNPAMLDVCLHQDRPKVVVGDPNQQIYSFRGAVNALALVEEHPETRVVKTLYLTQSFRFGPEIAFLAEACLTGLVRAEGARAPPLLGSGRADCITGAQGVEVAGSRQVAVLSRTNFAQFKEMVALVCRPPRASRPTIALPATPGAEDPHGWGVLVDLEHYRAGHRHRMSRRALGNSRYDISWEDFVERAECAYDLELLAKIQIVDTYRDSLPGYVAILEEQSLGRRITDPTVDYIFSTVHKFKGLECATVRLLDDFSYSDIPSRRPSAANRALLGKDEYNLLYVAVTRAKQNLIINDALFFLLTSSFVSFSFERLVLASECEGEACVRCGAQSTHGPGEQPAVSLVQDRVRVATSTFRRGGNLCSMCAVSPRIDQRDLRVKSRAGGAGYGGMVVPGGVMALEGILHPPELLEDPGHSFLAPILLPSSATKEQVDMHRLRLQGRGCRELVREKVVEFVPLVSVEQARREEREAVEALWGEEAVDEALVAACDEVVDWNRNIKRRKGMPYCCKCREEGHGSKYCPSKK